VRLNEGLGARLGGPGNEARWGLRAMLGGGLGARLGGAWELGLHQIWDYRFGCRKFFGSHDTQFPSAHHLAPLEG